MDIDVSKIKDPDLAAAVSRLGEVLRGAPKPRQQTVASTYDRNDWLHRNGSQQVARATQLRDAVRQGEKPEDA